MTGADVCAVATLDALGDVDLCEVILNNDCVSRAFLLALHAADTAGFTNLHQLCALVHAAACDHDGLIIRDKLNKLLGAYINAAATANALLAVSLCNTVNDAHCAELASIDTVAENNI